MASPGPAVPHLPVLHLVLRLRGSSKKRKKKTYTKPNRIKHKKKKVKLAVLQFYEVEDSGKVQRLRKECPNAECGASTFMISQADGMITHLVSLAENRLILSFALKTFYYDLLKKVGELFPGPSKATRSNLHAEADVERALRKVGWKIRKRGLTTTQFYFARLVEAVPA